MQPDWALAKLASGLFVLYADGEIEALEFNAFLQRIAANTIRADDVVASRVFTDGERRRVGNLRLYHMIQSGQVRTDDLPLRTPGGLLAQGEQARAFLRAMEDSAAPFPIASDAASLLRPLNIPLDALEDVASEAPKKVK